MTSFTWSFFSTLGALLVWTNATCQVVVPAYSSLEKHMKVTLLEDYSYLVDIRQTTIVLDAKGLDHGSYSIDIDQFTKIEHFEARIIDPKSGKTLRRIRSKDLSERATIGEGSIIEDSKINYFTVDNLPVPLKVEVELQIKREGNFNLPKWYPNSYYFQKITESSFEVAYPESIGLRYKEKLVTANAATDALPGWQKLWWEVRDLAPLDRKTEKEELPFVALAPIKFSMEGFAATMDSWQSFGKWFNHLNQGRDEIPDETKRQVIALTEGLSDDFEKIDVIYKYLQKNYRYVSIQLGIGGWRSMKASDVVAMKYGDCKGLSLLMKALLKEVGIPADYTLVLAGDDKEPIDVDFPSNQFNHVILRVPLPSDTLWLECTSTTLPTGYLGSFTKNRPVLVITEDGGLIDRTPSYAASEFHKSQLRLQVDLLESGDAKIVGKSRYWGEPAEIFGSLIYQLSEKEQKDFLNAKLGGRGLNLSSFEIVVSQERNVPTAEISFEGFVARFSQNTAKRVIVPLSWNKLPIEDLKNTQWEYEETIEITTDNPLVFEGEPPFWDVTTPDYQHALETVHEANKLLINKRIKTHLHPDTSEEAEREMLSGIQKEFQRQLTFKK
nr:DUF3857 domain-containing protein [Cytophagales bacterium]